MATGMTATPSLYTASATALSPTSDAIPSCDVRPSCDVTPTGGGRLFRGRSVSSEGSFRLRGSDMLPAFLRRLSRGGSVSESESGDSKPRSPGGSSSSSSSKSTGGGTSVVAPTPPGGQRSGSISSTSTAQRLCSQSNSKVKSLYRRPSSSQKSRAPDKYNMADMRRQQFAQRMLWISEPTELYEDNDVFCGADDCEQGGGGDDEKESSEGDSEANTSTARGREATRSATGLQRSGWRRRAQSIPALPTSILKRSLDSSPEAEDINPERTIRKQTSFREDVDIYYYRDRDIPTLVKGSRNSQKLKDKGLLCTVFEFHQEECSRGGSCKGSPRLERRCRSPSPAYQCCGKCRAAVGADTVFPHQPPLSEAAEGQACNGSYTCHSGSSPSESSGTVGCGCNANPQPCSSSCPSSSPSSASKSPSPSTASNSFLPSCSSQKPVATKNNDVSDSKDLVRHRDCHPRCASSSSSSGSSTSSSSGSSVDSDDSDAQNNNDFGLSHRSRRGGSGGSSGKRRHIRLKPHPQNLNSVCGLYGATSPTDQQQPPQHSIFTSKKMDIITGPEGGCERMRLVVGLGSDFLKSRTSVKAMSGGYSLIVLTYRNGGEGLLHQYVEKVFLPLKVDPYSVKAFMHKSGSLIIEANLAWDGI